MSQANTPQAPPVKTPAEKGFKAKLDANLWDLVQMHCLAGERRVVRVTSAGRLGYLFFDEGNVVHAMTADVSGERAASEILSWSDGAFEGCQIAWPKDRTIHTTWQNLLMLAAQRRDESGRGKLLEFPNDRVAQPPKTSSSPPPAPSTRPPPPVSEAAHKVQPSEPILAAVRLDQKGSVVSTKGESDEFPGVVSYATRLAQLIGDALGMGSFANLQSESASSKCVIYRTSSGQLVGVRATKDADISRMTEKMGVK